MTHDILDADFVILQPDSSSFRELLRQAVYARKTPVRSKWVNECIEQKEIVEFGQYALDSSHLKTKRGRQSRPDLFSHTHYSDEEEGQSEHESGEDGETDNTSRRKTKVQVKSPSKKMSPVKVKAATGVPKKKVVKKEKVKESAASTSDSTRTHKDKGKARDTLPQAVGQRWTPSPPPPAILASGSVGTDVKHPYTPEERAYFETYVGIILHRDPDSSNSTLCNKLFTKVGHTTISWSQTLTPPSVDATSFQTFLVNFHAEGAEQGHS